MNMYKGKKSNKSTFHSQLSDAYKKYEDGVIALEVLNKSIFLIVGEHVDQGEFLKAYLYHSTLENTNEHKINIEVAKGLGYIQAIKLWRSLTSSNLKEAKGYVEYNFPHLKEQYVS